MSAEVIEIGSDPGSESDKTPIQDESNNSLIIIDESQNNSPDHNGEDSRNSSPIVLSDPDDDVPIVDLIDVDTPMESPSPDLTITDVIPQEDLVPISVADELALEIKKKSKPKKVFDFQVLAPKDLSFR